MKSRALVVGGSLGGLFAANLLADLGWDVEVFERVPDDLAARGAGIGTHKELVEVLARLGIGMDERLGYTVGDRMCVDREGRLVHRAPWAHTMSAWAAVYRPLKDRFPSRQYHFGKSLAGFHESVDSVTATFEDGSSAAGDLLIGADGLRSTVRAQLFPQAVPQYAGYVAWRGLVDETLLSAKSRGTLANCYWFVLPKGEMSLCYPVPNRDTPGRKDWNYVWYRPVDDDRLRRLCTDAKGRHHALGIPPPLIRREITARLKKDAEALLPPHMAEIYTVSQPFFQAIYDVESPAMARGRVALLGDAAFVARPHVGMGVTKAALDAVSLQKSLQENDLDRYSRMRTEFGRRVIARARRLGAFIEAASRPDRPWTAEQLDQSPQRLLREVAAALSDIPELNSGTEP